MKNLGLFSAGAALVAATLLAVACSDSTTPLPVVGGNKADTGTSDSGAPDSGTPVVGDAGKDAATCLAKLRPSATVGIFCPNLPKPYGGTGRGGSCGTGETCCNGNPKVGADAGFDLTECKAGGAAACETPSDPTKAVDAWECGENDDCTAGQKCCMGGTATDAGARKPGKGTEPMYMCATRFGGNGTRCKAACDVDSELQLCSAPTDCATGTTCTVVSIGPKTTMTINTGVCE
jgi:hypothetical protein